MICYALRALSASFLWAFRALFRRSHPLIAASPRPLPQDLARMRDRHEREDPAIVFHAEIVDPALADRAARHGLAIEVWLRAGEGDRATEAFKRNVDRHLRHIYGPAYGQHDRVSGSYCITILRARSGAPVAASIHCFHYWGFRGWMEQVNARYHTPDIERLVFEIGHSALAFFARCDPEIALCFTDRPCVTVETGLFAKGFKPEDELMLRSLGYSLHTATRTGNTYRKQIRLV